MSDDYGEPWRGEDGRIFDREGDCIIYRLGGIADPERLRRAVACVNSLAGVSTEALEGGAVARLIETARNFVRCSADLSLSPYVSGNGLRGGSPWAEFVEAVKAFAPPPEGRPGA